jgi:hypothetical protein
LLKIAENNESIQLDSSDKALLEKLKRRLNAGRITAELEELLNSKDSKDQEKLIHILTAFQSEVVSSLVDQKVLQDVAKSIYGSIKHLSESDKEADIVKYIKTTGRIAKLLNSGGMDPRSFISKFDQVSTSANYDLSVRKVAVFEKILNGYSDLYDFKGYVPEADLGKMAEEIRGWGKSRDARKRQFAVAIVHCCKLCTTRPIVLFLILELILI